MRMEPLTQPDYLDGKVISIEWAVVRLNEGGTIYQCTAPAGIVEQLQTYLNGPTVRVFGTGTWARDVDGQWRLLAFSIEHFVTLDDTPLIDILK